MRKGEKREREGSSGKGRKKISVEKKKKKNQHEKRQLSRGQLGEGLAWDCSSSSPLTHPHTPHIAPHTTSCPLFPSKSCLWKEGRARQVGQACTEAATSWLILSSSIHQTNIYRWQWTVKRQTGWCINLRLSLSPLMENVWHAQHVWKTEKYQQHTTLYNLKWRHLNQSQKKIIYIMKWRSIKWKYLSTHLL